VGWTLCGITPAITQLFLYSTELRAGHFVELLLLQHNCFCTVPNCGLDTLRNYSCYNTIVSVQYRTAGWTLCGITPAIAQLFLYSTELWLDTLWNYSCYNTTVSVQYRTAGWTLWGITPATTQLFLYSTELRAGHFAELLLLQHNCFCTVPNCGLDTLRNYSCYNTIVSVQYRNAGWTLCGITPAVTQVFLHNTELWFFQNCLQPPDFRRRRYIAEVQRNPPPPPLVLARVYARERQLNHQTRSSSSI